MHIVAAQTKILQGPADVAAVVAAAVVDNTVVAVDRVHHTQMQYLPILLVLLDTDAVDVHVYYIVEDSYYYYYIPSYSDADHTYKGLGGRDNYCCMGSDQVLRLEVDIDTDLAAALAVGLGLAFVDIVVGIVAVDVDVVEDCFELVYALELVPVVVAAAVAVALCFDNNMDVPAPVAVEEFFDLDH